MNRLLCFLIVLILGCQKYTPTPEGTWKLLRRGELAMFIILSDSAMQTYYMNAWPCDTFPLPSHTFKRIKSKDHKWHFVQQNQPLDTVKINRNAEGEWYCQTGSISLRMVKTAMDVKLDEATYQSYERRSAVHSRYENFLGYEEANISEELALSLARVDSIRDKFLLTIGLNDDSITCWADQSTNSNQDFFQASANSRININLRILKEVLNKGVETSLHSKNIDEIYNPEIVVGTAVYDLTRTSVGETLVALNEIKRELLIRERK